MYHDESDDVLTFDFDELAAHLLDQGALVTPSRMHGFLCGLLSAGAPNRQQQRRQQQANYTSRYHGFVPSSPRHYSPLQSGPRIAQANARDRGNKVVPVRIRRQSGTSVSRKSQQAVPRRRDRGCRARSGSRMPDRGG